MKNLYSLFLSIFATILLNFSFAQVNQLPGNFGSNTHAGHGHIDESPKTCGFDDLHTEKMAEDSQYRQIIEDFERKWASGEFHMQKKAAGTVYQVPVVVHVLHEGEAEGTGFNISDDEVKAGIRYLNNYWRKVAGTVGDGAGVDMEIEFALAVRDESGNCTDGIVRRDMSANSTYTSCGVQRSSCGISDASAKTGAWNTSEYYNIYLVNYIDGDNCFTGGSYIAGYAYFASAHGQSYDGTVCLICSYVDESSNTMAHELGHAFNLYHTFEDGCSESNCSTGGDRCCDTGPHTQSECSSSSCSSGTAFDNSRYNYMSYCNTTERFTADQKTRAQAAMTGSRASFLQSNGNLSLVPPSAPTVDFTVGANVACQGSSLTFTDISDCIPNTYATNTGWPNHTFSWTFDNGVDAPYTSSLQNPTITFNNAGTYDVTLEITNGQGTFSETKTGYIVVSSGASATSCIPSSFNDGNFGHGSTFVGFNSISHSSSASTNPEYEDHTCDINTIIDDGIAYDLTVTFSAGNYGYDERMRVYIDWDNSATFEAGELVFNETTPNNSSNTVTVSITNPVGATKNTLLRMRVIGDAGQTPTLCGEGFIQEADDYGVYIQETVACSDPTITDFSATNGTICNGESTTLNVTGSLNDATAWHLYTGSCGGTAVANNATGSFSVSPTTTTTYYVRGEGGCVTPGSCSTLTITVNDAPTLGGDTEACVGSTANVTPSSGGTWASSNTGVATVTNGGVVTGVSAGSVTLTYTDGTTGCENTMSFDVNALPTLGGDTEVCVGSTANVTPSSGGTWASSNTSVATVTNGGVVTGVSTGSVTLTFTDGSTGCQNTMSFDVTTSVTPSVSISSDVGSTICSGDEVIFTATPTNGGGSPSYQWQVNGGNVGTDSDTYTTTGLANGDDVTVILTSSDACASPTTATSNTITMTVNDIPAQPGAITGVTNVCDGDTETYSISTVSGATGYTWTAPTGATITSGQGTTSIDVDFSGASSGNITITADNSCGSSSAESLSITVNTVANNAGAITGNSTVCENATGESYSINPVANATSYNWTVPVGATITSGASTNSITVDFGTSSGSISVTPTNSCGSGGSSNMSITITSSVTPSVSINSNVGSTICSGNEVIFTATPTNGGGSPSYQWQVNGGNVGTDSDTYTTTGLANGDDVTVILTSSNACASPTTATSNTITMTVNDIPAQPGAITGVTNVCDGDTEAYSISAVSGADSYSWTVPAGATINSGQGTTSIDVDFSGASSGDITVTADNACGSSTSQKVTISVDNCEIGPTYLIDKQCGKTHSLRQQLRAKLVDNATQYEWELESQGDGTILSGIVNSNRVLYLKDVPGIKYNTTYTIKARVNLDGIWSNWGKTCSITTEDYQITRIKDWYCGGTFKLGEKTRCYGVDLATDYWWEFTPQSGGSAINFYRGGEGVTMRFEEAGLIEGETYSVRIAPYIDGAYRYFGSSCNITIESGAAAIVSNDEYDLSLTQGQNREDDNSIESIEVEAITEINSETLTQPIDVSIFPNPISKNSYVSIALNGVTDENITISITDMYGKVVTVKEAKNSNGFIKEPIYIDNNYASGVYFVTIQSQQQKVVKRLVIQ